MAEFKQVISEMIVLFDEFLPLEEKKLQAVREDNLIALEDCMNQEQAVVLKLRGLEKKREAAQKENGWEGKSFREIIECIPEEQRLEYRQLFERLSRSLSMFQAANDSALDTIHVNLRRIENAVKQKNTKGTYGQDGTVTEDRPMTNRRV